MKDNFNVYQNAMNMFARAFLFVALVVTIVAYNSGFFSTLARIAELAH